MKSTRKCWPLDFDPEGAIYENLSWDLPGYVRRRLPVAGRKQSKKPAR